MHREAHSRLSARRARLLRKRLTISEARLWTGLKNRQTGARFRRQVPIGPWIVDFASFDPRLVVEVDGSTHDFSDETERTRDLQARGFAVLRFDNREIAADLAAAANTVAAWARALRETGFPPVG